MLNFYEKIIIEQNLKLHVDQNVKLRVDQNVKLRTMVFYLSDFLFSESFLIICELW